MSGLGGLNKTPNGVVLGLVQLQLPIGQDARRSGGTDAAHRRAWSARRAATCRPWISWCFRNTRCTACRWTPIRPSCVRSTGLRSRHSSGRAPINRIWGCFSIMESNPGAYPVQLRPDHRRYRRAAALLPQDAPWVPVEPWEPGDIGIPVIDGPKGAKIALIICHDGMFPEMARECAYKGAEIMIRTAGYTAPIRDAWRFTNQANAFCNLMVTANVCMCGSDGTFNSMGEGMIVNFDGTIIGPWHERPARRNHHRRGASRLWCAKRAVIGRSRTTSTSSVIAASRRCAAARRIALTPTCRTSSPAAIGCRGKLTCCYVDGTSCGFPAPTRRYGERLDRRRSNRCPPFPAIPIPGRSTAI